MKKFLVCCMVGCLMMSASLTCAGAAEIDVLLEKLVEKGVLTPLEAQIVKDETTTDVAKQISTGTMDTMPSWLQTITMKGDLRLRYQADQKESDNNLRNRARYRLRFGVYADPHPDLSVGFRLASGEDSISNSTNETMGDNFMKDDVWIDLAYAEYHPASGLYSIIGGKFESKPYLWKTTDLLWDGDINPEGFSIHSDYSLNSNVDVFANAGAWLLDEISSKSSHQTDPFIHYVQAGAAAANEQFSARAAGIYYGFNNVANKSLDQKYDLSNSSLPLMDSYSIANDYDSIGASLELAANELFGGLPMGIDNYMAVFGDYIQNVSHDVDNDQGWMVGVKMGHKKIKEVKSWQMKYMYGRLEENAWPDGYADSDRYGGDSNIKGHELSLEYALKKNVILGLDYYNVDRLDRELASSDEEQLFQADLVVKF